MAKQVDEERSFLDDAFDDKKNAELYAQHMGGGTKALVIVAIIVVVLLILVLGAFGCAAVVLGS